MSAGTAAFVVQLGCVYLFTALLKTSPIWRDEFTAGYYALGHQHHTNALGDWLIQFPALLKIGTCAAFLLELLGPILLFAPVGAAAVRTAVVLAMVAFHLGLVATMSLGTFPWICIVYWLCLLPAPAWDGLDAVLARARPAAGAVPLRGVGSWTANAVAAVLLLYVVALNVRRLDGWHAQVGGPPVWHLGRVVGLDQYWTMFAPHPYLFSRFTRLEGHLADGRVVNLEHPGEPFHEATPAAQGDTYPDQYWRRCCCSMFEQNDAVHQKGFALYFARQWDATHGPEERVTRVRFLLFLQPTPPPGVVPAAPPEVVRQTVLDLDLRPTAGE